MMAEPVKPARKMEEMRPRRRGYRLVMWSWERWKHMPPAPKSTAPAGRPLKAFVLEQPSRMRAVMFVNDPAGGAVFAFPGAGRFILRFFKNVFFLFFVFLLVFFSSHEGRLSLPVARGDYLLFRVYRAQQWQAGVYPGFGITTKFPHTTSLDILDTQRTRRVRNCRTFTN